MNKLIEFQASLQTKLVPATWIPFIKNVHSEEVEWIIEKDDAPYIVQAANSLPGFKVRQVDKNLMIIDYLTKRASWLDQFRIQVEDNGTVCRVDYSSTGLVPLVIPGAPLLNVILFFWPFGDGGKAEATTNKLHAKVEELSGHAIPSKLVRKSLSNFKKSDKKKK